LIYIFSIFTAKRKIIMSLEKINIRTWVVLLIMLAFAAMRSMSPDLFGSLANFTPVGAVALFGGVYFKNKWQGVFLPILVLLVSDLFINFAYFGYMTLWYSGVVWVYLSFLLIALVGRLVKEVKPGSILTSAFAAVLIHWIVTDFGVWLNNPAFAQTPAGFLQCLVAAIPFEKNFLAGTLLYSAVMFGGFEALKRAFPKLSLARN
jgi:hypothetical protein